MTKIEYIVQQLGRTKNKKYEAYVISRIIHKLNNFEIKFITQQYVLRPDGHHALTDLFFPQLSIHVEIDEKFHKLNIESDKIREEDIVNTTNHKIMRIKVDKSLDDINKDIDTLVYIIKKKVIKLKEENKWTPWDIDAEFNPETYIKKGYISISDNVAFKTIKDACNCFGHNYKGCQRGGAIHPKEEDTLLWFPKLFSNELWNNTITADEKIITEESKDNKINKEKVISTLLRQKNEEHKRIVFAKVKDNLGNILYRFRGQYKLDKPESKKRNCLVWKREKKKVKTYSNGMKNKK